MKKIGASKKLIVWIFFISALIFFIFYLILFQRSENSSKIKKASLEMASSKAETVIAKEINLKKIGKNNSEKKVDLKLNALSALSVKISKKGEDKIVFAKNPSKSLPIASLTKLMTAIIASEIYKPDLKIKISKQAVDQTEAIGDLKTGQVIEVKNLMKIMLVESSNDAAFALTEPIGEKVYVTLMNLQAKNLELTKTHFYNPTGLDPENVESNQINVSTVEDLEKIAKYILKQENILNIISIKELDLYLANGVFHHTLRTTNKLLGKIPAIIGGKTGWTQRAKGCLIEILKGKEPNSFIIDIVLHSNDRFGDMEKLIKYNKEQNLI